MTQKKLVTGGVTLFFFCILLLVLRTFWTLSHTFTPDFSVYYQAAENITHSLSVYTGPTSFTLFAYPLVSALFFIPFTLLPYQIAQTLFLSLSFLALLCISWFIPFLITGKRSLFAIAIIFCFSYLSFPTKFTLGMGQVNLVAYFFLMLSIMLYNRKKTFWIAFFFAVACVLKPILGFVLLFFILQKQWKISIYIISFILFSFVLGLVVDHHAMQDYLYYIQRVIPEVSRPVGKEIYYNQGFMSFVFREVPNQTWRLVVSYLGIVSILSIGLLQAMKNKRVLYQFSLLLSMLPLIDTVSWQHHFIVLIFPFSYVAYAFLKQKKIYRLVLLCIAYILVSWNFAHPELLRQSPANLLLSNTFYGAFMLFFLLVANHCAFSKKKLA